MAQGSTVREWLTVLARYIRTRPLVYRVVGVLAAAYTVVVAVDDDLALKRWLGGLAIGLLGWGLTRNARRLTATDLERRRRRAEGMFDRLFNRLPLSVAGRVEFLFGAILALAGLAIAVGSVFAL
jgi:hypothetical protein